MNKKTELIKNYLKNLMIRVTFTLIIFSFLFAISKFNSSEKIYYLLYEDTAIFTEIDKFYQKYLGGVIPIQNSSNVLTVFNNNIDYQNSSIYLDGIKVEIASPNLVYSNENGIVTYIGTKENYGNIIIVQGYNGISTMYGNLDNYSVKLYDYVKKGECLGNTKNNNLYLVYTKDGKIINPNKIEN